MSEAANRWFGRHSYVSEEKVVTLVMYKTGRVIDNPDGSFTLITNIVRNRKPLTLYIKTIETMHQNYVEIFVIKIHSGFLGDPTKF